MPDLETQIRDLLDHQVEAVVPVTVDEVRTRTVTVAAPAALAPRRRRRLALAGGLVAASLVAAGVLMIAASDGGEPATTVRATSPEEPTPTDVASTVLSEPLATGDSILVFPASGGPLSTTLLACLADRGYEPTMEVHRGGQIDGGPGAALTWSDADRSNLDLDADIGACAAAMDRDVFAIQNSGRLWPEGLPGPSQSRADAARDHVVPALAALPLDERAHPGVVTTDDAPVLWFTTGDEVWAVVSPPAGADGDDCTIGDPDEPYGSGYVCTADYSEVLHLTRGGEVLRAYPMPSAHPSWLYATAEAVYVGRVGDGAQPDSTVVRIDRASGEAAIVVFPADDASRPAFEGWDPAPADLDVSDIVQTGAEGPGTLVQSIIGPVRVQPDALAQLFGP